MARLVFFLIAALISAALGLDRFVSPLGHLVRHEGLQNLLQRSAMRMTKISPTCDISVKGMLTMLSTAVSYDGNVRSKQTARGVENNVDFVLRGKYQAMGFDGEFNADLRGLHLMIPAGKAIVLSFTGKSTFRFHGTFNGVPVNLNGRSKFSVDSDRSGKFSAVESGTFEAVFGGKQASGTFKGDTIGDSLTTTLEGTYAGKKFEFEFRARVDDMSSLLTIENEVTYRTVCNGKTFKGSFKQKGLQIIE